MRVEDEEKESIRKVKLLLKDRGREGGKRGQTPRGTRRVGRVWEGAGPEG